MVNKASNEDGRDIKVILGTKVLSEGLDFKGIRQVHIMEPWYNLSLNEQVIGRAVRNCSHLSLPQNQRNVGIYQYASTCATQVKGIDAQKETVDIKYYNLSELKDRKIKHVERNIAGVCSRL